MRVLDVRNVHDALPEGLSHLDLVGVERNSRNGPVLVSPVPVTTVYQKPLERVVFWPDRDANPFFHLAEALWMLQGRNDLEFVTKFIKDFGKFSDDGVTLHGAYGHRWRRNFGVDQLMVIVDNLRKNPDDRRSVLTMWDPRFDLGRNGKDLPCNLMVTFQRSARGELNMTVFCRSNDIILGAYGANAVHFSFLQEYLAQWIGCEVGTFTQISVNWHAYKSDLEKFRAIPRNSFDNPYTTSGKGRVFPLTMDWPGRISNVDEEIRMILEDVDTDHYRSGERFTSEWAYTVHGVLRAHRIWKSMASTEKRYLEAMKVLHDMPPTTDFVVAAEEWINRRWQKWNDAQSSQAWRESAQRGAEQIREEKK